MRILIKIAQKHEYERPLSPERFSPGHAYSRKWHISVLCSTNTVSVQESLDVTSQKPNFAVKNAESEPYFQSTRGFSPVLRNSFTKKALKIKKSAILLPFFLPIASPSSDGIFKKTNEKLEMQSCHNDVRAMTPCFYMSNEGATLGLSRAICKKSVGFCDIGDS